MKISANRLIVAVALLGCTATLAAEEVVHTNGWIEVGLNKLICPMMWQSRGVDAIIGMLAYASDVPIVVHQSASDILGKTGGAQTYPRTWMTPAQELVARGRIAGHIDGLEVRYFLSWIIHFLDLSATVQDFGIGLSRDRERRICAPVLDCWQETEGPWLDRCRKGLCEHVIIKGEDWQLDRLLSYLATLMDVNMLVDPDVVASSDFQKPYTPNFEYQAASNVLATVLTERGLAYRLQGGVVFITKDKNQARPNQAQEAIGAPGAPQPQR